MVYLRSLLALNDALANGARMYHHCTTAPDFAR
jgi:hypothetical protein